MAAAQARALAASSGQAYRGLSGRRAVERLPRDSQRVPGPGQRQVMLIPVPEAGGA
jgi:hypothetical protein